EDRQRDRLSSADLVLALNEMEHRPWPEWRRGKPLNQNSLSKLLKPFGIQPKKMRFGSETVRGYERDHMGDAYRRYVPAVMSPNSGESDLRSGTVEQVFKNNGLPEFQSGTSERHVPPSDSA